MDRKRLFRRHLQSRRFRIVIFILSILFVVGTAGNPQEIECGRHKGSSVCFCDCSYKIDLQLSGNNIQQRQQSLFQNNMSWKTNANSFDTKETFDKGMTKKQCSQSGSLQTGSECLLGME